MNLEQLFEQVLREMGESTSKQTGIVFASLTNAKIKQNINPLTDEEINKTTDSTLDRYGGGSNRNFYLKFTSSENNAKNRIDAWLENYLTSIKNNVNRTLLITETIGQKIKDCFKNKIKN